MKRKNAKKLLSSALCMAMLLSFVLPGFSGITASAAEVGTSYTYKFVQVDGAALVKDQTMGDSQDASNMSWAWTGGDPATIVQHHKGYPSERLTVANGSGYDLTLTLDVPETGAYDSAFLFKKYTWASDNVQIFIAPNGVENKTADIYYKGTISLAEEGADLAPYTHEIDRLYLESGKVDVTFRVGARSGTAQFYITDIQLTKVGKFQTMYYFAKPYNLETPTANGNLSIGCSYGEEGNMYDGKWSLVAGNAGITSTVSPGPNWSRVNMFSNVNGLGNNMAKDEYISFMINIPEDGIYDLAPLLLDYGYGHRDMGVYLAPANAENPLSEEYKIASENSNNGSGDLVKRIAKYENNILRKGDYILSFKAEKVDAGPYFFFKDLAVIKTGECEYSVSIDGASNGGVSAYEGFDKEYNVSVSMGKIPMDISKAKLSATVGSSDIASVSVSEDGKLVISGKKEGYTTVSVVAEFEDGTAKADYTLSVSYAPYVYNFAQQADVGTEMGDANDVNNMPWTLKNVKGAISYRDGEVHVTSSAGNANLVPGDGVSYEITVPVDGEYIVAQLFGVNTSQGNEVMVYLAPATATDPDAQHYNIAKVNTRSDYWASKTMMLKAGKYIITAKTMTTYSGYDIALGKLTLTKTGSYAEKNRFTFNLAQPSLAGANVEADTEYGAGTSEDMKWSVLADSTATASVTKPGETAISNGVPGDINYMRIYRTEGSQFLSIKVNIPEAGEYSVESLVAAQLANGFNSANADVGGANYAVIPNDVRYTEYMSLFATPVADIAAGKNRFTPTYMVDAYDYTETAPLNNDDLVLTKTEGVMLDAGEQVITLRLDHDVAAPGEMILISNLTFEKTGEYKPVYGYDMLSIYNENLTVSKANNLVPGTKYGEKGVASNMEWALSDKEEYSYSNTAQYSRFAWHGRTYLKEAENEFAFVLDVAKSGDYKVEFIYSVISGGAAQNLQMYAPTADAEDKKAEEFAIFDEPINQNASGKNCFPGSSFGTATLAAGANEIIVSADNLVTAIGMKLTLIKEKEVPVTSIVLDKTAIELEVGANDTIVATVEPSNATNGTVVWKSSDDAVATVVDGVVTAVAAGGATITATAGDFTATCVVTVKEKEPEFMEGDINGDGRLNTRDVVALRRHIAGGYEGNVVIEAACDMNGDGRLNSRDVKALREFITG